MRIRSSAVLGGTAALALAVGLLWSTARAADHADGPSASADPTADIDDVYAWMSPDAATLNLVMTIGRDVPASFQLSDQVQYVFHTSSRPSFGAAAASEVNVICEFETNGRARCWIGDADYVEGTASDASGIESKTGRVRLFTGVRNDPFFFNLAGFQAVARTVGTVAPSLTVDVAGCPRLETSTATALVNTLRTGKDDFAGFNAFAIVLSIDKTLLTQGGPILSVWASTNRK